VLAARIHNVLDLRIEELPVPAPGEGEVLLGVKAVGVCGSDIHNYAEGGIGDAVLTAPLVPGHEFAAVVEEVGPGVTSVKRGERVAVEPGRSCGVCEQCLHGHPNLCPNIRFCSTPPYDGAMRQFMTYPAEYLFPLPPNVDYAEGAVLEPLGVAIHSSDLGKVRAADTVAVLGSGPIGLLVIQLARLTGATEVFATDLLPYRLEAARRCGATVTINAAENDPAVEILQMTGGRGVDVAFEAAGAQETPQQAAEVARPGGRVVIIGIPSEDRMVLKASTVRRKGLTIKLVRRMKHTYPRAIALVSRGLVDVGSLVTHRFPLVETARAFELVRNYADGVIKAVIEM
jgi:L-iditol 2-dehydrogenase